MKKKILLVLASIFLFTACKEGNSKDGDINTSIFATKSTASQIIAYYNQIIDYDENASNKLSSLVDGDLKRLDKMVKNKRKNSNSMSWTAFIGIDPNVENIFDLKHKTNILKPNELLDEDLAAKVLPYAKGMHNCYKETKQAYEDFKKYYDNEDYKDDNWKKGGELNELIRTKSTNYYNNRNEFYNVFEKYVANAEEDILKDHPIKDQIIHAKRTLKLIDETLTLIEVENISFENIEKNYIEIETRFNESKNLYSEELKAQDKEDKFKSFYNQTDNFLGALRKAKRDKKITESEYRTIGSEYKSVVREYNYFVK